MYHKGLVLLIVLRGMIYTEQLSLIKKVFLLLDPGGFNKLIYREMQM